MKILYSFAELVHSLRRELGYEPVVPYTELDLANISYIVGISLKTIKCWVKTDRVLSKYVEKD